MKKNDLRTGILIGISAIILPLILMGTATTQTPTSVVPESHIYEFQVYGNGGGVLLNKQTGEVHSVNLVTNKKKKVTLK